MLYSQRVPLSYTQVSAEFQLWNYISNTLYALQLSNECLWVNERIRYKLCGGDNVSGTRPHDLYRSVASLAGYGASYSRHRCYRHKPACLRC